MVPNRPEVAGFDEYGFAIFAEESLHRTEDQRCHDYQVNEQSTSDVLLLQIIWDKLEKNFDQKHLVSPQKIRNFIKKGVPRELRGDFWQLLVGSRNLKNNATFDYQEKLSEVRKIMVDSGVTEYDGRKAALAISKMTGSFDEEEPNRIKVSEVDEETQNKLMSFRQILLDTGRSFPSHQMFMEGTPQGKEGRAALFRILALYTLYNPEVSYCQGMSYIAGMLLMNMGEEDAFWMLVSLFERPKYLSGYFDSSLSKIQRHSQVFERFLHQKMPKLYSHLKSNGIDPLLYITPWFMALFTSLPCWDSVLTIWDLLLLDGISVIFQASLAILHVLSDQLFAVSDMSSMLPMLLHLPPERIKRANLVPVIWRWTVYSWEVDAVLAIIDANNSSHTNSECKRKILDDDTNRPRKIPKKTKDNALAIERRKPTSLFKRFTKFVIDFLPASVKENAATNLVINAQSEKAPRFSSSSTVAGRTSREIDQGSLRPGPRKRRHHTASDSTQMFQKLRITSPLRRSPRIASVHSATKGLNISSSSEVISSSPNAKHAFKMFNTPTPMRISQISKTPGVVDIRDSTGVPQFSLSPDVELLHL